MTKKRNYKNILMIVALLASFSAYPAFAAPSVTTGPAVPSSAYLVNIYGTVNPNSSPTEAWVEYGTTTALGTPYGRQSAGAGASSVEVRVWVPRLEPNTTYYYQMVAQSGSSISRGEVKSFTTVLGGSTGTGSGTGSGSNTGNTGSTGSGTGSGTSSGVGSPSVLTQGTNSVSSNSAVVAGSINPNGAATNYWFQFGTSQNLTIATNVQTTGAYNTYQTITGTLSSLQPNQTYYYRLVGQNIYGTNSGEIRSFTTVGTGQVAGSTTGTGSGTGSAKGSGSGTNTGTNTGSGSTGGKANTGNKTGSGTSPENGEINSRPSFISLEYSLQDQDALVLVADNVNPGPGEDFSYNVVFKNDTSAIFYESGLKVIIPSEVDYVNSSIEPTKISGNIIEFNLGNIDPGTQGSVSVLVRIKETVQPGTNLIFTSVLGYKDSRGIQLATTSYMSVRTGGSGVVLGASFLSSLFSSSGMLWLIAFGLIILLGVLIYNLVSGRRRKIVMEDKEELKDEDIGLGKIPATFEPVGPFELVKE